jgi:hypothetical protein
MKYFVIISLVLILFFMGVQNWGALQKSADDDETIEEAINRLIAVHEGDSNSHLGVGESLEAHKSADVIDHPALSVVADKITKSNVILDTNFDSLDLFGTSGTVNVSTLDGVFLGVADGGSASSYLLIESQYFGKLIDKDKDMYWETSAIFTEGVSVNGSFGLVGGYANTSNGWGFQVRQGVLWAYSGYASGHDDLILDTVDIYTAHNYSAKYDHTLQKIHFYIDGVFVCTLNSTGSSNWYSDSTKIATISRVSTNDENLVLKYFYFNVDSA